MISSSMLDVITLGAVIPFLQVISNPQQLFEQYWGQRAAQLLGLSSAHQLVVPATLIFVAFAIISGLSRLLLLWYNVQVSFLTGTDLSIEAYRRTLYQSYEVHISRNSSEVIEGILGKVRITTAVLYNAFMLIGATVLICFITVALISINPWITCVVFLVFGAFYIGITKFFRIQLAQNSLRISLESNRLLQALQEGLGGIRDVLLNHSQPFYCETYRKSDIPLRQAMGKNMLIASSPAAIVETFGVVTIAVIACGFSYSTQNMQDVFPLLGVLALGSKRLIPSLHQAYSSWAMISGNRASVKDFLSLLEQPLPGWVNESIPGKLLFQSSLRLDKVDFRYRTGQEVILKEVSFEIKKGQWVAFVGETGSGKSTVLDILMGLLVPISGYLLIDEHRIINEQQLRAWQCNIAHVPQSIFLSDATFTENIALGIPLDEINLDWVKRAAYQARIDRFIEGQPQKYDTQIGERGIRLSGGQRQRIGIARALYRPKSVLVLDEATSALDNETERAVMASIQELSPELTILTIAHRLTTIKHCDLIFELSNGRVSASGTYEGLLARSKSFHKMVYGRNFAH